MNKKSTKSTIKSANPSSELAPKVSQKDERDKKKEKAPKVIVATVWTAPKKVQSHAERESERQKRFEERRLDKISKLKKAGASNQLIEDQVKSHLVKSAVKSISDKRANDPRIKKIIKDELRQVTKKNTSKKQGKYESKKVEDEFAAFDIDDMPEVDYKKDLDWNTALDTTEIKDDIKQEESTIDDLVTPKEIAVISKQARDAVKKVIKTKLEPIKQEKMKAISKQRDAKINQSHDVPTNFTVSSVRDDFRKARKVQAKEVCPSGYSKEDARALREYNNRRKQYKKDQKKERQQSRKSGQSFVLEAGDEKALADLGITEEQILICDTFDEKDDVESPSVEAEKTEKSNVYDEPREEDKSRFYFNAKQAEQDAKWRFYMNEMTELGFSKVLRYTKAIDKIVGVSAGSVSAFFNFIDMVQADTYFRFARASYNFKYALIGDDLPVSFMLANAMIDSAFVVSWKKAMNKTRQVFVTESGKKHAFSEIADLLDGGIAPISMILSGEFVQSFRSLVIQITAMRLFSKDTATKIYSLFGKSGVKDSSLVDLFSGVLSDTAKLFRMAGRIAEGESVSAVLSGRGGMDYYINALRDLDTKKNLLYSGLPVEGRISEVEWLSQVSDVVPFIQKHKGVYGPLTVERQRLDTVLTSVLLRREELMCRAGSQSRITPLCFVITGNPSIGKSKIIDFVLSQHSLALGRDYNPRYVYHKNKSSQFWDAYDPATMPYLHLSEVGNLQPNVAATMGDPSVLELLSLIDSQPYCVNQAKLEDKGKSWVKFEAIVVDTNCPEMNIATLFKNSAAYKRRFIQIDVRVKEKYAKASGQIDTSKLDDGSQFFDKWDFDVTEFEAETINKCVSVPIIRNKGVHELSRYIYEKTRSHTLRETKTLETMSDSNLYKGYGIRRDMMEEKKDFSMSDLRNQDLPPSGGFVFSKLAGANLPPQGGFVFSEMKTEAGNPISMVRSMFSRYGEFFIGNAKILQRLMKTICYSTCFRLLDHSVDIAGTVGILMFLFTLFVLAVIWLESYANSLMLLTFVVYMGYDLVIHFTNQWVRSTKEFYLEQLYIQWNSLLVFNGFTKEFHDNWLLRGKSLKRVIGIKHILTASAAGGALYMLWSFLSSKKENPFKAQSFTQFMEPSEYNEKINEVEKRVDASESYKRVPSKVVANWDNVIKVEVRNKHVNGIEELEKTVSANVRVIRVINHEKNTFHNTMGIGLKSNVLICNTHSLPSCPRFEIQVSRHGYLAKSDEMMITLVTPEVRKDLKDDMTLIWITGDAFRDITSHICDLSEFPRTLHTRICGSNNVSSYQKDFVIGHDDGTLKIGNSYMYKYAEHFKGMCGMPILGKIKDKSFILGMHVAGNVANADCLAIAFDRDFITKNIESSPCGLMPIMSMTSVADRVLGQLDDENLVLESGFDTPNAKSPINFLKLQNMVCYGKLPGEVCAFQKSSLVKTLFNTPDLVEMFFDEFNHVQQTVFGKPVMQPITRDGNYISPYNIFLEKFSSGKSSLDKNILQRCVDEYTNHIISGLEKKGHVLSEIRPLTLKASLNGVSYDCYSRRVTLSKAAGHGFPGKKKKHVNEVEQDVYEPNARLKREYFKILKCYEKDEISAFVYNATLKDEPRDVEKVKVGKTRVFFASSFPSLLVSKSFMSPLYSLMVESSECFNTAIGTDMHREAHDLLGRFRWLDCLMAGDYGSFDQTIPFDISWASSTVVYNLAKRCSYNADALNIVRGILSDGLFSFVVLLKDLYLMPGVQPSGKYGTAEDNSIKGVLMLMYAWYSIDIVRDHDFFENNDPLTYGDDVGNSVNPKFAPYFNDLVYSEFCRDIYRMKYTASNKADVYRPFTPLNEFTFLKRHFVYNKELKRVVAPLDLDSILKTLSWRLASEVVSEIDQIFAMMQSTCYELWFHCDKKKYIRVTDWIFDRFHAHFGDVVKDYKMDLPSYEKLTSSFMSQVMDFSEEENPQTDDTNHCGQTFKVNDIASFCNPKRDSDTLSERISDLSDESLSLASLQELYRLLNQYSAKLEQLEDNKESFDEKVVSDLKATIRCIETKIAKRRGFVTESGVVEMQTGTVSTSKESAIGTVEDVGGSDVKQHSGDVETFSILQKTDQELGEFLSRPVEIFSDQIALGVDYDQAIDPWDLFTNEPSVRAKLKNYAYIKGDLVVRISLAGNPFNMGKLQVAYVPFSDQNPILNRYIAVPAFRTGKLQYLSQQHGVVNMDPKFNKPTEIVCPFFSPAPMMRLFNSSTLALGAATSFDTIGSLGTIWLSTLNQMKSVSSGVATSVSLYVYAYMTNVSFGCPTATIMELTTESGKPQSIDERYSGPVSKWANTGTRFLDSFKAVPMLQPYVGPSSMVLSGIRDLASHFGFSRPSLISAANYVKNQPFQNSAMCIVGDTAQKISIDPKQEVDLVISGNMTEDEMSYSYLCKREWYFHTFTWATTDAPNTTALFSFGVNPCTVKPYASGANVLYQPGPMFMVANMHAYWKGKITYRVEIVASAFHRGKLAVVFEPNAAQAQLIRTDLKLNKQYTAIIDVQETQDFEFCVDMAHFREWAMVLDKSLYDCTDANLNSADLLNYLNGFVRFHVVNRLQSPTADGVEVNVFMRSDDMQFNRLVTTNLPQKATMVLESGEEIDLTCYELNQARMDDGKSSCRYFGEEPRSLRLVFKRFVTRESTSLTLNAGNTSLTEVYNCFLKPNPTPTALSGVIVNWQEYLMQAYVGMRGGLKYRWRVHGISGGDYIWNVVSLQASGNAIPIAAISQNTTPANLTFNGTVTFSPFINTGVEFDIPFYSPNLFIFANAANPWPSIEQINQHGTKAFNVNASIVSSASNRAIWRQMDHSLGDDFSFLYFTGCPPYSF